jgi:hypothetical protein
MLSVFRHIVDELKEGTHPAYTESLDQAIEHFEKRVREYPWQTPHERNEAQILIGELYHLKIRNRENEPAASKDANSESDKTLPP